jgi:hypothetical protein
MVYRQFLVLYQDEEEEEEDVECRIFLLWKNG